MSTVESAGTAGITLGYCGRSRPRGAIVSSTDAAAVFSVAGERNTTAPPHRLTLEVESGFNDPMAVILTTALTANAVAAGSMSVGGLVRDVVIELAIGGAIGWAIGRGGRYAIASFAFRRADCIPCSPGLALLAYGVLTLLHGSGFLGAYLRASRSATVIAHGTNFAACTMRWAVCTGGVFRCLACSCSRRDC